MVLTFLIFIDQLFEKYTIFEFGIFIDRGQVGKEILYRCGRYINATLIIIFFYSLLRIFEKTVTWDALKIKNTYSNNIFKSAKIIA